jgi:hypothetical protein
MEGNASTLDAMGYNRTNTSPIPKPFLSLVEELTGTAQTDQTISIDRVTAAALGRWREGQNREREFLGAGLPAGRLCIHLRGRATTSSRQRQVAEELGLGRTTVLAILKAASVRVRPQGRKY